VTTAGRPARRTPEERELDKKRSELGALETQLAQRELDLATLRGTLRAFEARYLRVVGRLYAELDDLQARFAEGEARHDAQNSDLHRRAAEARTRATESAEAVGAAIQREDEPDEFAPREDLKKLYREIAKLIHPDLTTDERERACRTLLMAEANRAYTAGDEVKLRAILDEWESSPDLVQGEGVAVELVRTIRKIHQVMRRVGDIEAETLELQRSEPYTLMRHVEAARARNRDLLEEMAEQLKEQIAVVRTDLGKRWSPEAAV
jgi:hypothetical protein